MEIEEDGINVDVIINHKRKTIIRESINREMIVRTLEDMTKGVNSRTHDHRVRTRKEKGEKKGSEGGNRRRSFNSKTVIYGIMRHM